jgi:hypothetical protein
MRKLITVSAVVEEIHGIAESELNEDGLHVSSAAALLHHHLQSWLKRMTAAPRRGWRFS